MFDEKEFLQNSKKFFLLLVFFSILFLFSNIFFVKKNIFEFATFLTKPIQNTALNSSKSVKDFFGVFSEVKTLRSDFYNLQEKYLKLQAKSNSLILLQEEHTALKQQLNSDIGEDVLMAEVLFQDLELRNESLLINKGLKDGVFQGDVVSIGQMYVGIVSEVYDFTAKVRLPTSRASSLRVMILDQEQKISEDFSQPRNYVSGIAVGYSSVLKIENIETHGNFEEGYSIFLNDPKVGTYLYLGDVLSIDKDPTLTLRSSTVKAPVQYSNLKYVFVRKDK